VVKLGGRAAYRSADRVAVEGERLGDLGQAAQKSQSEGKEGEEMSFHDRAVSANRAAGYMQPPQRPCPFRGYQLATDRPNRGRAKEQELQQ
jgi:hypothetical protein